MFVPQRHGCFSTKNGIGHKIFHEKHGMTLSHSVSVSLCRWKPGVEPIGSALFIQNHKILPGSKMTGHYLSLWSLLINRGSSFSFRTNQLWGNKAIFMTYLLKLFMLIWTQESRVIRLIIPFLWSIQSVSSLWTKNLFTKLTRDQLYRWSDYHWTTEKERVIIRLVYMGQKVSRHAAHDPEWNWVRVQSLESLWVWEFVSVSCEKVPIMQGKG